MARTLLLLRWMLILPASGCVIRRGDTMAADARAPQTLPLHPHHRLSQERPMPSYFQSGIAHNEEPQNSDTLGMRSSAQHELDGNRHPHGYRLLTPAGRLEAPASDSLDG